MQEQPALIVLKVSGKRAFHSFRNESGGHRFQRVPPNERRGRVHTSTITVAVLEVPREHEVRINPRDCEWQATRGSGAGGQHRNTTDSAVRLTHKPTGIVVWCEGERSQHQNKETALAVLRSRIKNAARAGRKQQRDRERRQQVGTGMRGDKRRTIRLQADEVQDHVLGVTLKAKGYMKGKLEPLYV